MISRRHLLALGGALLVPRSARGDSAAVVLGRFVTTYATDEAHRARGSNVVIAAEAIDGRALAPGATFSFNDAVGERTAAFGYAKAVVLRDGMIAEGTGGGACQVASTLHAAALLSGLEIALRVPHSRPSAYIRMGLDATVSHPRIDLRIKSTLCRAVTIRARAAKGSLEVAFEASAGEREAIVVTSEIVEWLSFARVVEKDRAIVDDGVHLTTFGVPGYRVRRTREIRGERASRDVRVDHYPPTNEVLRVGFSFDDARLSEPDAPRAVVDPAAVRPTLLQLRPSTRVTIDNG